MNPILAIAVVVLGLFGLIGAVRVLGRRLEWHPESQRKLVHMGMGVTTLSFPWLFHEAWPVIVLGVIALGALLALKHVPKLRRSIGGALHDVDRSSLGDLYFTIAVVLVFLASKGDPIHFCVPIVILTFADAIGALIGIRYGQTPFATLSGVKSAEGSVMFFLTSFMAAHVPLLLFSELGRPETLLISLVLAAMVTMVEAVATRGIDNLIIPIAGWYLVSRYMAMELPMLVERFVVVVSLMVFVLLLRRRSSLDGSSLLGVVLFAYACWALGGWPFLLIPFIFYVSHLISTHAVRRECSPCHDLRAVLSFAATGLVWLVLTEANTIEPLQYLFPFVMGIAAHFGIRNFTTLRVLRPEMSRRGMVLRSSAKAVTFCYLPLLLCQPMGTVALHAALAFGVCLLASFVFSQVYGQAGETPTHTQRWLIETIICISASLIPCLLLN